MDIKRTDFRNQYEISIKKTKRIKLATLIHLYFIFELDFILIHFAISLSNVYIISMIDPFMRFKVLQLKVLFKKTLKNCEVIKI